MIVIADTTPIRYLILIGAAEVLPRLYGEVVIPATVVEELTVSSAPEKVRSFVLSGPGWLRTTQVSKPVERALLEVLDQGESEAIQLASEISADLLLIDEKLGRRVALARGLEIIGTVGVLQIAERRGWLDLQSSLNSLQEEGFYLSAALRAKLREDE